MKKTHDLVVKTGEYQDSMGNKKNRWLNIGSLFTRDDGSLAIKIDSMPIGLPNWEGWINAYPKREGNGNKPDLNDDIPF